MARGRVTAARLAEVAAELADEAGLEGMTVSEVARRLGVKDANLYAHLGNAHELRVRVAVLALAELADRGAVALAGRAGKDALVAFAGVYRDYGREHPGRYAAMQVELDPETARASAGRRHSDMMRAILRGYALAEPDQTDAVRLLGSVFHGFVSLERTGGFRHHPRGADESWSRVLDTLDVALRAWPASPPEAVRNPG
ncbi:TetR/AcrR family transcriptional regulator [Streptosporangium sp. DT93]|uniref:TetR/AcrR family transcriptional regulator n=1 Tax=Streptosporangium sp. DT93 TaxID=3393428 RepID=UPI003CF3C3C9